MGIRIIGSDAQLNRWISGLNRVRDALPQIARSLAEESITLVSKGFRQKQDPYGGKWAPRKSGGGRALLVRTGAMRNSFHVAGAGAGGFTIASGAAYADFHQHGTSRMPARRMVPNPNDIPARWERAYDDLAEEILGSHLNG